VPKVIIIKKCGLKIFEILKTRKEILKMEVNFIIIIKLKWLINSLITIKKYKNRKVNHCYLKIKVLVGRLKARTIIIIIIGLVIVIIIRIRELVVLKRLMVIIE
jgi:hypothetical protein